MSLVKKQTQSVFIENSRHQNVADKITCINMSLVKITCTKMSLGKSIASKCP